MIDPELLEAAAQEQHAEPSNDQLAAISALARKQLRYERAVKRAEDLLKLRQAKLARVQELEIPDAMAAVGITEFSIDGGFKIKVEDAYFANIPSADSDKPELLERREGIFRWMREHNHGALIDNQIIVKTGKGEEEKARRVMNGLDKAGINYKNSESVHPSRLKAFVKEQLTKDSVEAFPVTLFGVHKKRVASIKATKSR